jgi:hypothetical protein
MRLLFDESLSPKLLSLVAGLFPGSESALRNGLAGCGDAVLLQSALREKRRCNDPAQVAADVLRRNPIRIANPATLRDHLVVLHR